MKDEPWYAFTFWGKLFGAHLGHNGPIIDVVSGLIFVHALHGSLLSDPGATEVGICGRFIICAHSCDITCSSSHFWRRKKGFRFVSSHFSTLMFVCIWTNRGKQEVSQDTSYYNFRFARQNVQKTCCSLHVGTGGFFEAHPERMVFLRASFPDTLGVLLTCWSCQAGHW